MNGPFLYAGGVLAGLLALSGCKPPPTDAAIARSDEISQPARPSAPQASPDTTLAIWTQSAQPQRLVYGVPGQPVLLSLECVEGGTEKAGIIITRHAPADKGAGALLALIGNGAIGRIAVDATEVGGRRLWQGQGAAMDAAWEPFTGPREVTATVPGAGLVRFNPSALPRTLLAQCRGMLSPEPPANPG